MPRRRQGLRGERRASVRYPHHSGASCRLLGPAEVAPWRAEVRDISPGGALLVMDRAVSLGAVLEVALAGPGGGTGRVLLMRVRDVRPGDGATWLAGCSFVRPLAQHDLEVLMLESVARKHP